MKSEQGTFLDQLPFVPHMYVKINLHLLKELGVQDSKNLNDDKISAIAKQIIKFVPYSLLILHNEKYNKMQQSGMSQGKLKALLHNQAIGTFLKKISPEKPESHLNRSICQRR